MKKQLITFEPMITYYGNPTDGYQYKGKDEVVIAYIDSEATRKELKEHGINHLRPGGVYLGNCSFLYANDCVRKGWSKRLAKRMQKEWDRNPTANNLPLFLQKNRKNLRTLLTESN